MDNRDKILDFIKVKGPVLPVQISKEIGTNILMASAHLAELTATGKLKISSVKVGGSPLYYLAGQEAMLQKFIGSFNDKEKKAYDLLEQSKILRDMEQEPVVRVALRGIKDFALPLNVNYNNSSEIFWKWYLAGSEEVEQLIKSKLNLVEKPSEKKPEEKIEANIQKKEEERPAERKIVQQKIDEKKAQKEKTLKKAKTEIEDPFLGDIIKFFDKNKIAVLSTEVIKKSSETDFIIEIPTVVGSLQYYCKAKNKKRISESDLSGAYVKGQFRKLPVIFISKGDLSPKAQSMVGKELTNITFKKL